MSKPDRNKSVLEFHSNYLSPVPLLVAIIFKMETNTTDLSNSTASMNQTINGRMAYIPPYNYRSADYLDKRNSEIAVSIFLSLFFLCILVMIIQRCLTPCIKRISGKKYRVYPEEDTVAHRTL